MEPLRYLSDQELLAGLKNNNQEAYLKIYDRFYELLLIYACKVVKDDDEAADLVQDIFIFLWDKRHQLDVKTSLANYLYTSVRYRFFDLLDQKKIRTDYAKRLSAFAEQGEFLVDQFVRERELVRLIETEVSLLPEKMQHIFRLSRNDNLTNTEIAEKLGISEKTVRNQLHNALKTLRNKLRSSNIVLTLLFF